MDQKNRIKLVCNKGNCLIIQQITHSMMRIQGCIVLSWNRMRLLFTSVLEGSIWKFLKRKRWIWQKKCWEWGITKKISSGFCLEGQSLWSARIPIFLTIETLHLRGIRRFIFSWQKSRTKDTTNFIKSMDCLLFLNFQSIVDNKSKKRIRSGKLWWSTSNKRSKIYLINDPQILNNTFLLEMGGHGGLNILPQKKWNVYNWDNR